MIKTQGVFTTVHFQARERGKYDRPKIGNGKMERQRLFIILLVNCLIFGQTSFFSIRKPRVTFAKLCAPQVSSGLVILLDSDSTEGLESYLQDQGKA